MPENNRIALAAVVVTGVVGVAAPLITWRAGVDAQRTAARAERARSDLAEIRSILDRSLIDLAVLRRAEARFSTDRSRAASQMVREARARLGVDRVRVEIRLGPGALSSSIDRTLTLAQVFERGQISYDRAVTGIRKEVAAFAAEAYKVVGARIPAD